METLDTPNGSLALPSSWEQRTTVLLSEPVTPALGVRLAKPAPPMPRATIMIVQGRTAASSSVPLRDALVRQLRQQARGLRVIELGTDAFLDGALGAFVTLAFEVLPGVVTHQRHVFRVDHGTVTQLTASVVETQIERLAELAVRMRSFIPLARADGN